jgi:sugar phosphate isomerase/epimerase
MKYGMNLLLWTGELNDGIIPTLKMLKSIGYDGVELPIFPTSTTSGGERCWTILAWSGPP